jgi:hypothetical protein
MPKPFQCENCRNWYVAVVRRDPTTNEEVECLLCVEGLHAPHTMTNIIDCHFDHETATPSERQMAGFHDASELLVGVLIEADKLIETSQAQGSIDNALSRAEAAMEAFHRDTAGMDESMRWAGVMELPGQSGELPERRFKDITALQRLVNENRRPASDLVVLNRSVRNCTELKAEIDRNIAQGQELLAMTRVAARTFTKPAPSPAPSPGEKAETRTPEQVQATQDRMARVRAARKSKQAVSTA